MALLSEPGVQRALPQTAAKTVVELSDLLAQAQALADRIAGYPLESAARDHYLTVPRYMDTIVLRAGPVTEIEAVTETPLTPSVLTRDTHYSADLPEGILYRLGGYCWAAGSRAVRVQYTAGWTLATVVAEPLYTALVKLVAWLLDPGDVGTKTDSLDGYSRTKEDLVDGIPASIHGLLAGYRRFGL